MQYTGTKLEDPAVTHDLITVIGNLLNNALDAVSHTENKNISISFRYVQEQLHIEITDTGVGLTKEEQDIMFDQGFSTKGEDRGFGLYFVDQSIKN